MLNEVSGAISWNSNHQSLVATSTAEAEAAAFFAVTQELVFLKELGAKLGMTKSLPSSDFSDTQTKNSVSFQNVKRFAIKRHFLQAKLVEKVLEVKFCPTKNTAADVLTKAVGRVKFQRFSREIAGDIITKKNRNFN